MHPLFHYYITIAIYNLQKQLQFVDYSLTLHYKGKIDDTRWK